MAHFWLLGPGEALWPILKVWSFPSIGVDLPQEGWLWGAKPEILTHRFTFSPLVPGG